MMDARRMKVCAIGVAAALLLSVLAFAGAKSPESSPLDPARAALRGKRFDEAIRALDKALAEAHEHPDEAFYLRALALYYSGEHNLAVQVADDLIQEHEGSPWLRKARFLKAQSLIRQRKFKDAERIYEEEANRLLSKGRKQGIAGVFIELADALATKPDPSDVGAPPPNYGKAYNLYGRALELEIGRELRDRVMFKRARTIQLAGNHQQAIKDYREYLAEFDPDWTGEVGSMTRLANQKREKHGPTGQHAFEARFRLAEAQLSVDEHVSARINLEDVLTLMGQRTKDEKPDERLVRLIAEARWLLVRTYRLPKAPHSELDRAVKEARDFLADHDDDPHAVVAAFRIAQAYEHHGRSDQAVDAYEAFIAGEGYNLPAGDAATERLQDFNKSPAELQDEWRKLALYQIGQIRFGQRKYAEAVGVWQDYIAKYPNGPHWSQCQHGVVDAEFQVAVDAVAE